jgi:manganese oxidase
MTRLMIRALGAAPSRSPLHAIAAVLYALALTAAAGFWAHLIDRADGVTRSGESAWFCAAVLTAAVAAFGAVAASASSALLGVMSAASGGAFEQNFAALVAGRLFVVLPATLLVAGLVTLALARAKPWSVPATGSVVRIPATRAAMGAATIGAALLALAGVVGESVAPSARAAGGPGQPCPTGASVRDYRVQAIDVDITVNRFGDHDPLGKMFVLTGYGSTPRTVGDGQGATYAATGQLADVRTQETSRHVSIGLRDDPIQPLVIRANVGECVEISFTNEVLGNDVGMHIDGLSYDIGSSGDAIGQNVSSTATSGVADPTIYRYYVPDDPGAEGGHYIRPGPGMRQLVNHGLFGVLAVQPKGSTYRDSYSGDPLPSGWGWEAIIDPPGSAKSFREHVPILHEIGNEKEKTLLNAANVPVEVFGLLSSSYRPGTRALNYRSEPFENRLTREQRAKSLAYNAYTFGDPATPMPRSYLGDPTKVRLMHGGTEMLHVYHLHGGGIRWRLNPKADPTFDYQDTGLNKHPVANSGSQRLDSQSQAPGDSYNLEIEGGAGGVQQSAGDFLFHCHIAHHYVSGMWSYWRVHDTNQLDLAVLPDRAALPTPVESAGLMGKTMPDGTLIDSAAKLTNWVEPQLPSRGVPLDWDGSVWNWDKSGNTYLGAPEDTAAWPNLTSENDVSRPWDPGGQVRALADHPGLFVGDQVVSGRPKILFNPVNGRPAHPLTRPQIGTRAPFSPNGHSGAPWLGERGLAARTAPDDPFGNRQDGICPTGSEQKRFNLVSVDLSIEVAPGLRDDKGKLFVLAKNKAGVLNGTKPREPLAVRLNRGQCGFVTLVSEQPDDAFDGQPFSMTNAHIHHVQFDVQGSDGVGTGMQFGQAVRPYRIEDTTLASAANAGSMTLNLDAAPVTSINGLAKFRTGIWIGVGLGTEDIEIRKITGRTGNTISLNKPLEKSHPAGQWTGTEFVQYVWYPDVALDNIFWHDHVDGIHNWGHGLVSQLIIEPPGSTYHDPTTGEEIDSGTIADIRTTTPLIPGVVDGSFREFAALAIDENPATDSTYNLRSEPFDGRLGPAGNPDPSLVLSSYTHGDPFTPIPRAYVGDPVVIRHLSTSPAGDTFVLDGHTFQVDSRLTSSSPTDAVVHGISERFTLALKGGAGGVLGQSGDYLYRNGVGRRFRQGAWGILRVLDRQSADLQPLPGRSPAPGPFVLPAPTGGRPPSTGGDPGNPCPGTAPIHPFAVSAVDLPVGVPVPGAPPTITKTFVPTKDAGAVAGGLIQPEPLVLRVAEGECVEVTFTNDLAAERASFHVGELVESPRSSGVNVGYNPEQTVGPGEKTVYRYYARDARVGAATISDFGGSDSGPAGMYGAIIVAPRGASFRDPVSGAYKDTGVQVDVSAPGVAPYRDMAAIFMADDPEIGQNDMPYPAAVAGAAFLNHRATPIVDGPAAFSSALAGDPATAVYTAEANDPTVMHAVGAPGMESINSFTVGGHAWRRDAAVPASEWVSADRLGSGIALDMNLIGGAGGPAGAVGDHFVGDLRRPFTEAGTWGLLRVSAPGASGMLPLSTPFPAVPWKPRSASDPGFVVPQSAIEFPKLSGLRVPKRVSLQSLLKNGLRVGVGGTTSYGKITLKLNRGKVVLASAEIPQRVAPKTKRKPLRAPTSMAVTAAGVANITWRVPARALAKMRPGKHLVSLVWRGQTLSGTTTVFDATCRKVRSRVKVVRNGVTRTVTRTKVVCGKAATNKRGAVPAKG